MKNNFSQRKASVLSKQDKSSRGKWDEKIFELCDKINSFDEYYTTSSCAGRVVIIVDQDKKESDLFRFVSHDLLELSQLKESLDSVGGDLKFKQEPCILHVACRTLEDAKNLLDKGREAGWKKSGILSLGDKIVVELGGTEKLEFPIVSDEKLLVKDDFLNVVVGKSNDNLKKSWGKINRLLKYLH